MLGRIKTKLMGNCHNGSNMGSLTIDVNAKPSTKKGTNLRTWVNIPQIGQVPGKRSGHAVVALGQKAYLFGGCGDDSDCLDDFYSFDFNSHCWKKLQPAVPGPSARASFELSLGPYDGTIIIGGGTAKDGLHGDIFEYNIFTREWRELIFEEGHDIAVDFLSSYGQTLRAYENSLIGFGGSSGTSYSNCTIRMNLRLLKCEKLETTGSVPSPRYKHQSVVVDDRMYIIGGGNYRPRTEVLDIFVLGLHSLEWSQPKTTGDAPEARVAHSCVYDEFANSFYVWGGFNESLERLNDFHCLNLTTMTWSPIRAEGGNPPPRAFHAAAFYESTLYIFGGADGEKRFADVWAYNMRQSPPSLMVLAAQSPAITPLATPMATPSHGRSREGSVGRLSQLVSAKASLASSANVSGANTPVRTRSREPSICTDLDNRAGLITAEAVMSALREEEEKDERGSKKFRRTPTGKRRVAPFFGSSETEGLVGNSTEQTVEFMIPGEGILPSEVLNGIQGLAFGADSFSHGLPKESRPSIPASAIPSPRDDPVPYA